VTPPHPQLPEPERQGKIEELVVSLVKVEDVCAPRASVEKQTQSKESGMRESLCDGASVVSQRLQEEQRKGKVSEDTEVGVEDGQGCGASTVDDASLSHSRVRVIWEERVKRAEGEIEGRTRASIVHS
jgi:hypothetical protein